MIQKHHRVTQTHICWAGLKGKLHIWTHLNAAQRAAPEPEPADPSDPPSSFFCSTEVTLNSNCAHVTASSSGPPSDPPLTGTAGAPYDEPSQLQAVTSALVNGYSSVSGSSRCQSKVSVTSSQRTKTCACVHVCMSKYRFSLHQPKKETWHEATAYLMTPPTPPTPTHVGVGHWKPKTLNRPFKPVQWSQIYV